MTTSERRTLRAEERSLWEAANRERDPVRRERLRQSAIRIHETLRAADRGRYAPPLDSEGTPE